MAEFLDSFDVEREGLLKALENLKLVWSKFQERSLLEVEGSDESDSMIMAELRQVEKELEQTQFTIGIFGLIKRGKSTLLNSLIGRQVSSMHVTPETAVPVYVTYGEEPSATVNFADGTSKEVAVDEVQKYTSQKFNPNNEMGVTIAQQRVPVGFLRNGTRLIDTPGLDDAEADEVYTERTLQELDVVDAGVILFLSPPTVSHTEMKFLEQVVARDLHKTFLVCNMYPQHFHDRETRKAVLQYVGGRIVEASRRQGRKGEVRVYPVCALEAWNAREMDDIEMWKKSGADRLLRDIENYLADNAGRQVLVDAAERIARASQMARAEVAVRQSLLNDPAQLGTFQQQLNDSIKMLEREFERIMAQSISDVEPMVDRIRKVLALPFSRAKKELEDIESLEDIPAFTSRLKRSIEVRGENASVQFAEGFSHIVEKLKDELQGHFSTVMTDMVPNLPSIELSTNTLLSATDTAGTQQQEQRSAKQASLAGSAVGGGVAGTAAFFTLGAALGPLGLLGGALVGWNLSSVLSDRRSVDKTRTALTESMDEILAQLYRGLDEQVEDAVVTVRHAVEHRRRTFAADLYAQYSVVKSISEDPTKLDTYRKDASRFVEAFDACERRAYQAVSIVPASGVA